MCGVSRYGLTESLGGPGRSVDFMDYQEFNDKRVARTPIHHLDAGDSLQAHVNTLGEFRKYDDAKFSIAEPTPRQKQIRSVVVPEAELVTWPFSPPRSSGRRC